MSKPTIKRELVAGDLTGLVCGDLPGRRIATDRTTFAFRRLLLAVTEALLQLADQRSLANEVQPWANKRHPSGVTLRASFPYCPGRVYHRSRAVDEELSQWAERAILYGYYIDSILVRRNFQRQDL
jgi:hypothetical protein